MVKFYSFIGFVLLFCGQLFSQNHKTDLEKDITLVGELARFQSACGYNMASSLDLTNKYVDSSIASEVHARQVATTAYLTALLKESQELVDGDFRPADDVEVVNVELALSRLEERSSVAIVDENNKKLLSHLGMDRDVRVNIENPDLDFQFGSAIDVQTEASLFNPKIVALNSAIHQLECEIGALLVCEVHNHNLINQHRCTLLILEEERDRECLTLKKEVASAYEKFLEHGDSFDVWNGAFQGSEKLVENAIKKYAARTIDLETAISQVSRMHRVQEKFFPIQKQRLVSKYKLHVLLGRSKPLVRSKAAGGGEPPRNVFSSRAN